ncbi:MAG: ParB N-terminal domain-containing protein [Limnothrix sp. RL_2_0]|nr:ParB N-terminal domain-containing protein [Limnothrix sp. RL_2_0]
MKKSVPLSKIVLDAGTQIRAKISQDTIEEYAERLKAGDEFPPVILFYDRAEDAYYMGDGFHRYHAHKLNKKRNIEAEIKKGDLRDAVLFAVEANTTHGLKRTNADKRRAVQTLLEDEEWASWSDREISRRCAVSNKFVGDVRRSLCMEHSERTYKDKHGKTVKMNVENIGHKPKTQGVVAKFKLSLRTKKLLEKYSVSHGMDQDRVIEEALKEYFGGKL